MEDLSRFCCQNERCVAYGGYGAGNLSVCDRIGKRRDIRLLYCKVCRKRFSERKGTVFYRAHTDPAKVVSILTHVQEGCGMRATGRLLGIKEGHPLREARGPARGGVARAARGPFPLAPARCSWTRSGRSSARSNGAATTRTCVTIAKATAGTT